MVIPTQTVPMLAGRNGLRHKLMRSHMAVAIIALFTLLISLGAILMLDTSVKRLTEVRGPTARSSSRALAGLHRTLASLRGWVSVPDPLFKEERHQAWNQDVIQSLDQLELLSKDWTGQENRDRLITVGDILEDLKEAQWHIEDVAQTPGNEPARVLLDLEIYPLGEAISSSITDLIEIEKSRLTNTHGKKLLGLMADMQFSLSQSRTMLSEFATHGDPSTKISIHANLKTLLKCTDCIAKHQLDLSSDQNDLLDGIKFDLQSYLPLAEKVIDVRQRDDWNVAQYLLVTQAIPRARQAANLLASMSMSQSKLSAGDGHRINIICNIVIAGSLVMIVVLIIGTYVASTRGAKQITDPVTILSLATEDLANGRLSEDIPIFTTDEIGQLTQSFNLMRRRLHESDLEVRNRETRIRALVDTAANGILTIDEEGLIQTFNPEAEKMFGYLSSEIIGSHVWLLIPSINPEARDNNNEKNFAVVMREVIGKPHELLAKRKNKSKFSIELSVAEIVTDIERTFSGIVTDITERKEMEKKLADMNSDLVKTSRAAGMAEIATGVLHNVGNVLNSVNISASLVTEKVNKSRLPNLAKTSSMMIDQGDNIGDFISQHDKGKLIPGYLVKLSSILADEHRFMLDELQLLTKNIEHIKTIVKAQQTYARVKPVKELASITELVDDALSVNAQALDRQGITVVREYGDIASAMFDKQKLLQILINLIRNARQAIDEYDQGEKKLTIRITENSSDEIVIDIIDTGTGITEENLSRIFQHGFTTKTDGHGFGLHSCANAAKEMKGSLNVSSAGAGQGAMFTVQFPVTHEMAIV